MTSFCKSFKVYLSKMTSTNGKLFLCVLFVFITLFLLYLGYSKYTLINSQNDIKDSYTKHIRKADSLYIDLLNYNKAMTDNILSLNSGLLADSLIKSTLISNNKLSRKQYNALSSLIQSHSTVLAHCQQQYESKIQRDSLRLGIERDLLAGQTKTMVDLHLNKIEHEYSNITMWAAILTILFLVFSFYSIFKMDELIQQGNDGVNDIKRLKRDGEKEVKGLKITTSELITDTKRTVDTFIQEQQKRMNETFNTVMERISSIEKMSNNSLKEFDGQRQTLDEEFKRISKEYENRIKQLLDEKNKQFQEINDKMNNLITQTSTYINNLNNNKTVSVKTETGNNMSSNVTESDNNV